MTPKTRDPYIHYDVVAQCALPVVTPLVMNFQNIVFTKRLQRKFETFLKFQIPRITGLAG